MDIVEEQPRLKPSVQEGAPAAIEAATSPAERRKGDRFPIQRELTFRELNSRTGTGAGVGQTLNISSTGVLFSTGENLTPGKRVELSISWPIQLNGNCGLKLVARGRVARAQTGLAAVKIDRYEFRTAGVNVLHPLREAMPLVLHF